MSKKMIIGLFGIIGCLLAGCDSSTHRLVRLGNENAMAYIKDKYNIIPKIRETECITESTQLIGPDFFPPNNGIVRVFMEYDGRDFEVQISGETESAEGYDNYQYSEILDKIEDLLKTELAITPCIINADYGDIYYSDNDSYGRKHGKHLINEYYDGRNLKDIFENIREQGCRADLNVIVAGEDIGNIKETVISDIFGDIRFSLYNFEGDFDFDTMDETRQEIFFSTSGDNIWPYHIFMRDSFVYDKGELTYVTYDPKECDDIFYISDNDGEMNVSDRDISLDDAMADAPELSGYKNLGRSFDLPESARMVHIWMPAKNYITDDILNIDYLLSFTGINGIKYYHYKAEKTWDRQYVAFSVLITDEMKNVKVTLIGK